MVFMMTITLGKNPNNGGNPPNLNMLIITVSLLDGDILVDS